MMSSLHSLDADPTPHLRELLSSQRFGQDICKLIVGANVVDFTLAFFHAIPYVMIPYINVLTSIMMHWILT